MTTDRGITRTPTRLCPCCGEPHSALGTYDHSDAAPSPGDWTVCAYCLEPLVIGLGLVLNRPAPGQLAALRVTEPDHWQEIEDARARLRQVFPRQATGPRGRA